MPFADCAWQAGFAAWVATCGLTRDDARHHRLVIGSFIRGRADWASLRTRPGYAAILAHTASLGLGLGGQGLSLRAVQYHVRAIEGAGWLAVIEKGTTAQFRPWLLHAGEPNLRREWRLTRATPTTCTPSPRILRVDPIAGARGCAITRRGQSETRFDGRCAPDSPFPAPHRRAWSPPCPSDRKPQRRRGMLDAGELLRGLSPDLSRVSARRLRSICRVFWACDLPGRDWTPAGILAASISTPDGAAVPWPRRAHDPAWELSRRLAVWLDADGRPLPPPSWTSPPLPVWQSARRPQPWRERGLTRPERGLTGPELAEHDRAERDATRWAGFGYLRMVTGLAAADDERLRQLAAATSAGASVPAAADAAEAERRARALAQVAAARRSRGE